MKSPLNFSRPAILYSIGKDSSVLLTLARKAFAPARMPFPLIHVDTGFKFRELFRAIERKFRGIHDQAGRLAVQFIPTCAPDGDNVAQPSARTPWFHGPSLLEYLETIPVRPHARDQALR